VCVPRLSPPLGLGKGASSTDVLRFVFDLDIPLLNGRVPFQRTAYELVRRCSGAEIPEGILKDQVGWRRHVCVETGSTSTKCNVCVDTSACCALTPWGKLNSKPPYEVPVQHSRSMCGPSCSHPTSGSQANASALLACRFAVSSGCPGWAAKNAETRHNPHVMS
jgi:hypothetical protein